MTLDKNLTATAAATNNTAAALDTKLTTLDKNLEKGSNAANDEAALSAAVAPVAAINNTADAAANNTATAESLEGAKKKVLTYKERQAELKIKAAVFIFILKTKKTDKKPISRNAPRHSDSLSRSVRMRPRHLPKCMPFSQINKKININ